MSPALFNVAVCLSGEPAEVVRNVIPSSTIMSMIRMSWTKASGRLTPNGRSVIERVRRMSSRTSSIPSEPGTSPIAPASATAATSVGLATYPIGAWTMGMCTPNMRVMRLSNSIGRKLGHSEYLSRSGLRLPSAHTDGGNR